jgi:hypothetical protein
LPELARGDVGLKLHSRQHRFDRDVNRRLFLLTPDAPKAPCYAPLRSSVLVVAGCPAPHRQLAAALAVASASLRRLDWHAASRVPRWRQRGPHVLLDRQREKVDAILAGHCDEKSRRKSGEAQHNGQRSTRPADRAPRAIPIAVAATAPARSVFQLRSPSVSAVARSLRVTVSRLG